MIGMMSRRDLLMSMGQVGGGLMVAAAAPSIAGDFTFKPQPSSSGWSQTHAQKRVNLPRRGDFGSQPLVGLFDPAPGDGTHRSTYFGMPLDAAWPYGALYTDSGKLYILMRRIVMQTTNYLMIGGATPQGQLLERDLMGKVQWGAMVKRFMDGSTDVYKGAMPGRPGFEFRNGTDEFSWVEDGVLSLKGKAFAPAWHTYVPWREDKGAGTQWGCYYTSRCWKADGEINGEKVKGFVMLDQDYLPPGIEWNDNINLIWSKLQEMWGVFATEYDDGTIEWGHFCKGFGDFQFGTVSSNRNDLELSSRVVDAKVGWGDGGFVKRIDWTFDGREKWEFVTAPDGNFVEMAALLNKVNGTEWRGHAGTMLRVGEKRKVVRSMAWQEVFPMRLTSQG